MQISVVRTGGFAGLSETLAAADTDVIDRKAARALEAVVREMRFFSLPAVVGRSPIGADLERYEVTINDGQRRHTVAYTDPHAPEAEPLVRLLELLASVSS